MKECIDEIVLQQSRNFETVKEIVSENSLLAVHTKSSHADMYKLTLKLVAKLEKIFRNNNFVKYLTNKQKGELTKKVESLAIILNPPK
ncbi:hypothetical protein [Ureibacillus aquaedulcis]|uniref:Uncharacterized protein n=1 Tax=Ureibacillus aquaedulcis TaxID=3058421 RepID=A0ABT8GW40_9BACL|nr:hypothetical protein [Ureibacillus sp. BA0131]MDN4495131.1 hypothetical protein [Ureibacillus sp. BA0131]